MKGRICPACGERHGQSLFSLLGSSKFSPIKCAQCGSCFHFANWVWLLLLSMVLPVGLIGSSSFLLGAVFFALYLLGWLAIAANSKPKRGPRFG